MKTTDRNPEARAADVLEIANKLFYDGDEDLMDPTTAFVGVTAGNDKWDVRAELNPQGTVWLDIKAKNEDSDDAQITLLPEDLPRLIQALSRVQRCLDSIFSLRAQKSKTVS